MTEALPEHASRPANRPATTDPRDTEIAELRQALAEAQVHEIQRDPVNARATIVAFRRRGEQRWRRLPEG